MADAGILSGEKVEFINGLVVLKTPKNRPHMIVLDLLKKWMLTHMPAGYSVQTQEPVRAVACEPEPDLTIIRGAPADYPTKHPGNTDVPLVVEVSEATLRADRGVKLRTYARSGFVMYWVVNLSRGQIEVYSEPADAYYRSCRIYLPGDTIPFAIGDQTLQLDVTAVLPPKTANS